MRVAVAKRLALVVLGLASLWGFVPIDVSVEAEQRPTLDYPWRGVTFLLDERGRVEVLSVQQAWRLGAQVALPRGAARPGEDAAVPGVGACGLRLGDAEDTIVATLGEPSRRVASGSPFHLVDLAYEDILVLSAGAEVISVSTCREGVRTQEGLDVGSSRDQIVAAYGSPEEDQKAAYGAAPVAGPATAMPWHRHAARLLFRTLLASLAICVLLTLVPRGPAWAVVVLACVGVWIGHPLARFVHGVLECVPGYLGRGDLEDALAGLWSLMQGGPEYHCRPAFPTPLDCVVGQFKAWLRAPMPTLYGLGAMVGLFAGGGLAARWRRRGLARYVLAAAGGVVLGTAAAAVPVVLRPPVPRIVQVMWGPRTWDPLTRAALPSLALVVGFLIVAWQVGRWWHATQLAMGIRLEDEGRAAMG